MNVVCNIRDQKNIIRIICDQYNGICVSNISYVSPYLDETKLVSTVIHEFLHFVRGSYILWASFLNSGDVFIEECLAMMAKKYFIKNTNIEEIIEITNRCMVVDINTCRKLATKCIKLFKKNHRKLFVDNNHTFFLMTAMII